ncbi:MAG: bifunctional nuclease family protein [Planctomycetota bacterium]
MTRRAARRYSAVAMNLVAATIERVIASTSDEFAVVLRTAEKTFLIFVGHAEAFAIFRELKGTRSRRPLPHDLMASVLRGFEIDVGRVAISSIVDSTFCATLLLRQAPAVGEARRELRLDLRASDAMILALKSGRELFVTEAVLSQVEDVSELLGSADDADESGFEGGLGL